jgi:hypothetical protein
VGGGRAEHPPGHRPRECLTPNIDELGDSPDATIGHLAGSSVHDELEPNQHSDYERRALVAHDALSQPLLRCPHDGCTRPRLCLARTAEEPVWRSYRRADAMTPGILGLSHISLSVWIVTRPNASDATPAVATHT